MNKKNSLDYIETASDSSTEVDESMDKLKKVHHKVKHGKLKIQRKKIKEQILKGHTPRDLKREKICKTAREKAHSIMANTRRDISNEVRSGLHESQLTIVNESATTISGLYGLDFMEESTGWGVNFEFFEKPTTTPITESIDMGTTPKGRKRRCKAIGIAEGVFAPISDITGKRVFSRNNRLYESDHWEYQLDNLNFSDRLNSRRMLGTIGHYDKKVDDKDLAEGKVSHIITALEIREDDVHGRYLWGRLEILNTPAGRLLKEYYDNDIPLFVSSRGGGKLISVPDKAYKLVSKQKYYCEGFDVVKEPGFLEAQPVYYNNEDTDETFEDLVSQLSALTGVDETKLYDVFAENGISESLVKHNEVIEEDNVMTKGKVNVNVTTAEGTEQILANLLKPMTEKLNMVVDTVEKIQSDLYEAEESSVEETTEVKEEATEVAEPAKEEAPAEEKPAEVEAPAEEVKEEKVEEVAEPAKEKAPAEEKPAEEAPVEAVEEAKEEKAEKEDCEKAEKKECDKADCKKEEKEEKVDEQWAHQDPKETAPEIKDFPNAKNAKDDPEGKAMKADVVKDAKEVAKHVNAGIEGGAKATVAEAEEVKPEEAEVKEVEAPAEEKIEEPVKEEAEETQPTEVATDLTQEITDYKAMYETLKSEVDESVSTLGELIEMFQDLGKKYKEVVTERNNMSNDMAVLKEQLIGAQKELNSYKLVEKFNITVEKANDLLSSKDYNSVVEELKEAETTQIENEAQAKAEEVSEAISESIQPKATVARRRNVYSAFSAPIKESLDNETSEVSEAKETINPRVRRRVYSAFS